MNVEELQEEQNEERQRRIEMLSRFQKQNATMLHEGIIQKIQKPTNDIKEQEKPIEIKEEKPKLIKEVQHTQEPQKELKDLLLANVDDETMFSQIARTRQANKFNVNNKANSANKSGLFQRQLVS